MMCAFTDSVWCKDILPVVFPLIDVRALFIFVRTLMLFNICPIKTIGFLKYQQYNFKVLVLEYFHFMLPCTSTSLHFRGRYYFILYIPLHLPDMYS